MSLVQSEGSRIRLVAGARVDLIITASSPNLPCGVAAPGGVTVKETKKKNVRTYSFQAPNQAWSGTFLLAFGFVPDANGDLDPAEFFRVQVDDPKSPGLDVNVATIRPRPGNLNPIPFSLDFVV